MLIVLRRASLIPAILLACIISGLPLDPARAEFPERTVRMLVNSVAGGGADTLARLLADKMAIALKQPVVVDNRPGAGGNLAAELIARAAPDGYSILLADSGPLVINPALYPKLSFDPLKDFAPVSRVASFPVIILAHPNLGVSTLGEFIAKAKTMPGKIDYASTGIGSPQHLAAEMLRSAAGLDMVHVPYRGGAPAVVDLLAGRVPLGFIGLPPTAQYVRGGELRGLAITTAERSAVVPQVPTVAESGFPGYSAAVWFGIVAPRGTPSAVVATLNGAVNEALSATDTKARLAELGYAAEPSTRDAFASYLAEETKRWGAAVKSSGARVD